MSNRALQVGGLALLGGVGYYMYRAGGDPKTAQKHAEGKQTTTPPLNPNITLSTTLPNRLANHMLSQPTQQSSPTK